MVAHDMDMDMGTAASSPSSDMNQTSMGGMVFSAGTTTPLYSAAWAPGNPGTYAATCIFLVVLAMLFRAILAAKAVLEARWLDREMARRYVVVAGRQNLGDRISADPAKQNLTLSENGVEENVTVVQRKDGGRLRRPWRLSVDPVRAAIDALIAGVGYLLMLAVMTMNVGYFLSVLAGVFLGSLAVGRFAVNAEH